MDDVVGEIVLAVGDEDLLPGDAVGAVGGAFGARAQRADVRSRLRLGELHRAGPFAADQLFGRYARLSASLPWALSASTEPMVKTGPSAERHRGAVPHFRAGGVDHLGQPLAAPFGRRGEPVPAALAPAAIGLFPTRRGDDRAVLEGCTDAVTDAVERRDALRRPCGRLPSAPPRCRPS